MDTIQVRAGCSGKDSYTFLEARQTAERMRRNQDLSVVAYHCKFCGRAHVGDDQSVQRMKRIQWIMKKRALQYAGL